MALKVTNLSKFLVKPPESDNVGRRGKKQKGSRRLRDEQRRLLLPELFIESSGPSAFSKTLLPTMLCWSRTHDTAATTG